MTVKGATKDSLRASSIAGTSTDRPLTEQDISWRLYCWLFRLEGMCYYIIKYL